jgi:hypothetical protein
MISPFKQAIVDAGFVANEFQLDLNQCLEDPSPRYPRSRMFKWPVSVDRHDDRLTICHPLIAMEPFVMRVAATLRVPLGIEPDPAGCLCTPWHHAVDLANDKDHADLIATRRYATDRAIMRGIVINAMGGRLTTANARRILAEICPEVLDVEPLDRSAHALSRAGGILHPGFIDSGSANGKAPTEKGKWAVNLHSRRDPIAELWAAVHGIEDGWFMRDRYGYQNMSPTGLARYMGVPVPVSP